MRSNVRVQESRTGLDIAVVGNEAVVAEALRIGYIQEEEVKLLNDWRRDPAHWDGV